MSQEKMTYDPETGIVQYRTKKKKGPEALQTFSALDWLARLSAQIPNKKDRPKQDRLTPSGGRPWWEQMVRYYGYD